MAHVSTHTPKSTKEQLLEKQLEELTNRCDKFEELYKLHYNEWDLMFDFILERDMVDEWRFYRNEHI